MFLVCFFNKPVQNGTKKNVGFPKETVCHQFFIFSSRNCLTYISYRSTQYFILPHFLQKSHYIHCVCLLFHIIQCLENTAIASYAHTWNLLGFGDKVSHRPGTAHAGYRGCRCASVPTFLGGWLWCSHSGPPVCKAGTFLTEPSPQLTP